MIQEIYMTDMRSVLGHDHHAFQQTPPPVESDYERGYRRGYEDGRRDASARDYSPVYPQPVAPLPWIMTDGPLFRY